MEQLHHQTSESLEGSGDADSGADFNEDTFRGVDVDLQLSSLVYWRIK